MCRKYFNIIFILVVMLALGLSSVAMADEIGKPDNLVVDEQDSEISADPAGEADAGIMLTSSASGSSISVNDGSAMANGTDALEFIMDLDAPANAEQIVIVFAERNGALSDCDFINGNSAAGYYIVDASFAGEQTIRVTSTVAGTVTLKAYVVTGWDGLSIAEVYNGSSDFIKAAFVGNGCTGKFTAVSSEIMADVATAAVGNTVPVANNGVDYYNVSMRFTKGGQKIVGEKVKVSVSDAACGVSASEMYTSVTGGVAFRVFAETAGNYDVTVTCGTYMQTLNFEFAPVTAEIDPTLAAEVRFSQSVCRPLAVDYTETVAAQLLAIDGNGAPMTAEGFYNGGSRDNFTAVVIEAPAESSLQGEELDIIYNPNACGELYLSFCPDAAGVYKLKVYNNITGKSDVTYLEAAEFGTIDHAEITYAADTYAYGQRTQAATVYLYDENGVRKFASSKKFAYSGAEAAAFNTANGQLTLKDDSYYAGQQITISVVANNRYPASTTLTIGGKPSSLSFAAASGAVGQKVRADFVIADENGEFTALSAISDYAVDVQSAFVSAKPTGANVSLDCTAIINEAAMLLKKGCGYVTVSSDQAGTVQADVVIAFTNNVVVTKNGKDYAPGEYTFYLSGTLSVEFADSAPPIISADLPLNIKAVVDDSDKAAVQASVTAQAADSYRWQYYEQGAWQNIDAEVYPSALTAALKAALPSTAEKLRCRIGNDYGNIFSRECELVFLPDNVQTVPPESYTYSGSCIAVQDSLAKANGTDALEFILDVDNALNADQMIVVFAERNDSLSDCDFINGSDTAGYYILDASSAGERTIKVTSTAAGTVELTAYLVTGWDSHSIAEIYNGSSDIIKTALVGSGCSGKFTAVSNEIMAEYTVCNQDGNSIAVSSNGEYTGARANNGLDYYRVSMKFTKGGSVLAGENVKLYLDKAGAVLDKEEVTTSANGKIEFKVSAEKAGTYKVIVECGNYSEDLTFTFGVAQIDRAVISYTVGYPVAVDCTETVAMQVVAYDANGRAVDADATLVAILNDNFVIECTSAPAGSALGNSTDFTFCYNPNVTENIYISFTPDVAGTYNFKIYNDTTGVADTTSITAAEFGEIDHATITYPAAAYALGEQTQAATVYVYDQNGVKKLATSKAFSYVGDGVEAFNSNNGQVTFVRDKAYVGKTVTVKVIAYGQYAASTTVKIGGEPISLQGAKGQALAGEEAVVNVQVVDINGEPVAVSAQGNYSVAVQSAIIIAKPEGATASVDADSLVISQANLLKKGTGKVTLTSNKEGTVKANIVLALTNNNEMTVDGKDYAPGEYSFCLSGIMEAEFISTEAPVITVDLPDSVAVGKGSTGTSLIDLSITASRAESYQWQFTNSLLNDWQDLNAALYPSAATNHLAEELDNSIAAQYRCAVTNSYGTIYSNVCTVSFVQLPQITQDLPASAVVVPNADGTWPVDLSVAADNALSFQWQFYTEAYGGWNDINITTYPTAATAHLTADMPANITKYRCKISNAAGSIYSNECVLADNVPVESIELDLQEVELTQIGEQAILTATVYPAEASNKSVLWSSDNEAVATVADGIVTAIANGQAVITAASEDGDHQATCTVTVQDLAGQAAAPQSNIAAGTVLAGTKVILATATEGARIYYTVDGSQPDESAVLYTAPIVINESVTIKAVAVKEGLQNSAVSSFNYTAASGEEPAIVVGNARAHEGETAKISVSLQNNPGLTVMRLKVNYDSSVMQLTAVEDAGALGSETHSDNLEAVPYILYWNNGAEQNDYTVNGEIVTLTFALSQTAEAGYYPVSISYSPEDDIFNAATENVEFTVINGSIEIPDLLIGDVNGDGKVNTLDDIYLARYLGNWQGYESKVDLLAADLNGDNAVNLKDGIIMARHLAGWRGYETLPYLK